MPGGLPKKTARALLDVEDPAMVPIIRDPAKVSEESDAVFYFPGCGSERLFGQVGLATQALLYHVGSQCVLPPGYLCCGYPQTSAGRADQGETASRCRTACSSIAWPTRSTTSTSGPSWSRAARAWTSCRSTNSTTIFPGCRLLDIHEYLLEKGVKLEGVAGRALHVPRPLPHADEDLRAAEGGERAHGAHRHRDQRSLLRGVGHVRRDASRHRHPGALPQGRGDAQGRGRRARRRLRRAR